MFIKPNYSLSTRSIKRLQFLYDIFKSNTTQTPHMCKPDINATNILIFNRLWWQWVLRLYTARGLQQLAHSCIWKSNKILNFFQQPGRCATFIFKRGLATFVISVGSKFNYLEYQRLAKSNVLSPVLRLRGPHNIQLHVPKACISQSLRLLNLLSSYLVFSFTQNSHTAHNSVSASHVPLSKANSHKNIRYVITLSSKSRGLWFNLVSAPTSTTGFLAIRPITRTIVGFSAMQVAWAYSIGRSYKTSFVVKLLAACFLRRYLVILRITKATLYASAGIDDFESFWLTIVEPSNEIFFHPIYANLLGDMSLRISRRSKPSTQLDNFFNRQYAKYSSYYTQTRTSVVFEDAWFRFKTQFLKKVVEVTREPSWGYRYFWNYGLKMDHIVLPTNLSRKVVARRPIRSIRRRISKRMTKDTQMRSWVF